MASAIDNRATPCARNLSHRLCQYGGSAMEIPRMRGSTSVSQASPRTHSSDNALGIVGLWRTFRKETISATLANLLDQSKTLMRTHTDVRFASKRTCTHTSTHDFMNVHFTKRQPTWNSRLAPTRNSKLTFVIAKTQLGIPDWDQPGIPSWCQHGIPGWIQSGILSWFAFQATSNLESQVGF